MMKKFMLSVITMVLVLSMAACGNKVEEVENKVPGTSVVEVTEAPEVETTEVPSTTMPSEEPTSVSTEEPTVAPTEEPTVAPTDEPTKDFVDETEPVEGNKDEVTTTPEPEKEETPVIVPGDPTTDDGTGNGGGNTNPSDGNTGNGGNSGNEGNSGNGGTNVDPNPGTTTPEPTNPPTTTPEPEKPTTPSAGDNLNYNNSITLPSGAKLPVLNEFNTAGLDPNNSFWGDWNSQIVADNMETYISGLDGVVDTWGSGNYAQDFAYSANSMQWFKNSFDNHPSLSVDRKDGYYVLKIALPLDEGVAGMLGWTFDSNDEARSREALTCLLACVSSTPNEIQQEVLFLLYDENYEMSRIPSDGSWGNVGDAKIRLNYADIGGTPGTHYVELHIKGN